MGARSKLLNNGGDDDDDDDDGDVVSGCGDGGDDDGDGLRALAARPRATGYRAGRAPAGREGGGEEKE